mmetsp:Transcript_18927/g.22609  ORF Transcript_18927/g.22609 Transcript_18927/m.22609 type:complete len:249 (-) Transcript_18927:297-1043(-)
MVWSVIQNVQKSIKYRGGMMGFFQHMYTNGDYPFKFGTFMGADAAGNRYYENRVDYPFGQHRWVEPGDIHNYDAASMAPEWHTWMTHMNDAPPCAQEQFLSDAGDKIDPLCQSHAPGGTDHGDSMVGHMEGTTHFHNLHNQSQVRSRGYNIGNHVVGLPPGVKDSYYTQPGSPYNDASIRPLEMVGSLDADGGRAYKNDKWADRLTTDAEKEAVEEKKALQAKTLTKGVISRKAMARRNRGGAAAWGA